MDDHFTVKVSDFGVASIRSPAVDTSRVSINDSEFNSLQWTAPEVLRQEPYGTPSDVFSFGVLCWEVWTECIPFEDLPTLELVVGISINRLRLEIPSDCPIALRELIQDVLHC